MRTILKAFLCGVATATPSTTPGFGGSLSQAGFDSLTTIFSPIIFENIKDIQIPEIDFDGGNLKNIDIKIPAPASYDDIKIQLENPGNDMDLVAQDLQAVLNADFKYKYGITVSGKAAVNIKKMNLDFAIAFDTQPGNPSSELAPKLTVSKMNVDINPDDIDIKLSGSLVTKIASIFIPFFKKTIIPLVVKDMETQIQSIITDTIDPGLAQNGTQATIPYLAGVTFDFCQLANGPQVSADQVFSIQMNGTFFDSEKVQASAYTPATWNVRDPKGKMFQGYITDYTLNTAFESMALTGNTLDITYLLQNYLNFTVTTDMIGQAVPEFITKYGSGKAVGIAGAIVGAPTVTKFATDGQSIDGSIVLTMTVDNEVALIAEFDNFQGKGIISTKSGSVFGSIGTASIGTLGSNFTTTLGVTKEQLQQELQGEVDEVIAQVNKELAAGIKVPSFEGIDLSDFELNFQKGFLEFGMSVDAKFWEFIFQRPAVVAAPAPSEDLVFLQ